MADMPLFPILLITWQLRKLHLWERQHFIKSTLLIIWANEGERHRNSKEKKMIMQGFSNLWVIEKLLLTAVEILSACSLIILKTIRFMENMYQI
jgi:hypothetical protein